MPKPRRKKRSRAVEDRNSAERLLNEFRQTVSERSLDMEEPLRYATQFVRVLELAQFSPEEKIQCIGGLAVEARLKLDAVHDLWLALREELVLDTSPP
ncbi:MAG TPA: hypothetical protein VG889_01220 [Rhizomicrobium sp.]|nr:hypothetical protein [Rhizomicrobium sp.]